MQVLTGARGNSPRHTKSEGACHNAMERHVVIEGVAIAITVAVRWLTRWPKVDHPEVQALLHQVI